MLHTLPYYAKYEMSRRFANAICRKDFALLCRPHRGPTCLYSSTATSSNSSRAAAGALDVGQQDVTHHAVPIASKLPAVSLITIPTSGQHVQPELAGHAILSDLELRTHRLQADTEQHCGPLQANAEEQSNLLWSEDDPTSQLGCEVNFVSQVQQHQQHDTNVDSLPSHAHHGSSGSGDSPDGGQHTDDGQLTHQRRQSHAAASTSYDIRQQLHRPGRKRGRHKSQSQEAPYHSSEQCMQVQEPPVVLQSEHQSVQPSYASNDRSGKQATATHMMAGQQQEQHLQQSHPQQHTSQLKQHMPAQSSQAACKDRAATFTLPDLPGPRYSAAASSLAIMRRLQTISSCKEALQLVEQSSWFLTAAHVGLLWCCCQPWLQLVADNTGLADVCSTNGKQKPEDVVVRSLVQQLCKLTIKHHEKLPAQALASAFQALPCIWHTHVTVQLQPCLQQLLTHRMQDLASSMTAHQLCDCLEGCAKLGWYLDIPGKVLDNMICAAVHGGCSSVEAGRLLHTVSQLRFGPSTSSIQQLVSCFAAGQEVDAHRAACVLHALAALQYQPEETLEQILHGISGSLSQLSPAESAVLLVSCADLLIEPWEEWMQQCYAVLQGKLSQLPASLLCAVLASLPQFDVLPTDEWLWECCRAISTHLASCGPSQLAALPVSLMSLRHQPPAYWWQGYCTAVSKQVMQRMSQQQLCGVLVAAAWLAPQAVAADWARNMSTAMAAHKDRVPLQQALAVVRAQLSLGVQPARKWVKPQLLRKGVCCTAADWIAVLCCVASLQYHPGASWLTQFEHNTLPKLGTMSAAQVLSALQAVSALRHVPSAAWAHACMSAVQQLSAAGLMSPAEETALGRQLEVLSRALQEVQQANEQLTWSTGLHSASDLQHPGFLEQHAREQHAHMSKTVVEVCSDVELADCHPDHIQHGLHCQCMQQPQQDGRNLPLNKQQRQADITDDDDSDVLWDHVLAEIQLDASYVSDQSSAVISCGDAIEFELSGQSQLVPRFSKRRGPALTCMGAPD